MRRSSRWTQHFAWCQTAIAVPVTSHESFEFPRPDLALGDPFFSAALYYTFCTLSETTVVCCNRRSLIRLREIRLQKRWRDLFVNLLHNRRRREIALSADAISRVGCLSIKMHAKFFRVIDEGHGTWEFFRMRGIRE